MAVIAPTGPITAETRQLDGADLPGLTSTSRDLPGDEVSASSRFSFGEAHAQKQSEVDHRRANDESLLTTSCRPGRFRYLRSGGPLNPALHPGDV